MMDSQPNNYLERAIERQAATIEELREELKASRSIEVKALRRFAAINQEYITFSIRVMNVFEKIDARLGSQSDYKPVEREELLSYREELLQVCKEQIDALNNIRHNLT